jgi:histidinol-phosphate/aromatic aminotransferase/cobyric acid decarboxylase-like protein
MIPLEGAHGGDGPAIAHALGLDPATILDLSQSLNPFAPDVETLAAGHLASLRRYPDPREGERRLAAALGVEVERVLLTNGGSEAIALVAAEVGGTVAAEPEFSLHPRSGHGPRWSSNPRNPTGLLAPDDEQADVWDEAFFPLATGAWTRGDHDAIVVGSLTKVFACPGLRLGYVLADEAEAIGRRRPEWSVNALALAVLGDLLDRADLRGWSAAIASARGDLVALLAAHGLVAEASDAPWVLVRASGLRNRLAPHGVVVRGCAGFGLPDHVRIAVPDAAGLARLGTALERSCDAT